MTDGPKELNDIVPSLHLLVQKVNEKHPACQMLVVAWQKMGPGNGPNTVNVTSCIIASCTHQEARAVLNSAILSLDEPEEAMVGHG